MEIMFDDLTEDAQKRLLREAGVSKPEDIGITQQISYFLRNIIKRHTNHFCCEQL
jgi:hypothetical protein